MRKHTRRRQYKRKPKLLEPLQLIIWGVECLLLLSILGIIFADRVFPQRKKPIIETQRSEVQRMPAKVKEAISAVTPAATYRVPILLYHYVEYVQDKRDTIRQSLTINPYIFEQQIKTLKEAGYTFMTAEDIGKVIDGKMVLPQKPVIITIDDGHWDILTDILPILQKYNAKATAYIVPGLLGDSDFLTKDQLKKVIDSKRIEIGAHTVHHVSLAGTSLKEVTYEITESKKMLEDSYHIRVVSFAYPNGAFDLQAAQAAKDAGFTTAVSTLPGNEQSDINRYFLYRLRPGERTGDYLLTWLQQNTFRAY